jgi:hypothetical protein
MKRFLTLISFLLVASLSGCATLRDVAALRQVDFRFDRVSDARVAGVSLARIHSYDDLTALELGRLGLAIASKDVPLDIIVHVEGRNPETNRVTARLVAMDWAYLVDDRETLSGRLDRAYSFPPGEPQDVPLTVTFNLVRFFGGDGRDLLETALALSGQRASTKRVTLRLAPTVDTPVGPIRYAVPLVLTAPAAPAR